MKSKRIIPLLSLLLIAITFIIYMLSGTDARKSKNPEKPDDWFFRQRAFPQGEINHEAYLHAIQKARKIKETNMKGDSAFWTFAGPLNTGGRLSDVAMHPSDDQVIFVGAASGGIFRSQNAGLTWAPIFDDAMSLNIGDLAIAPSDPARIYAGTGEANGGGGSITYDGVGLYRSNNGGDSWEYIGLPESRNIGRIAIHPNDPDLVYVAAMGSLFADNPERGVYRSQDGGQTWEKTLFISDSTGAIDLCINPIHPDTMYAAMWERVRRPDRRSYGGITSGIYRSVDGGTTWTELTSGLPSSASDKGRIGIDLCTSYPETLYAIYADKTGYFQGVYKSTDHGTSWQQTNDGALGSSYQSYGWWFGRIKVDPVDQNIAFVIGFDLYKTTTGGNSWSNVSSWNVHVDQHEVYIDPGDNDFVVLGNDGGLYISSNGGSTWNWVNNLPITQFYTCEVDEQYPGRLYGGTQDNGTNRTMSGGLTDWEMIYGGDGFYVLVDPLDNSFVYAEYQYGNLARSTNGGSSFYSAMNGISSSDRKNWNTPVVFDPQNPSILYYGANRLYRSVDKAASWSAISPDLSNGPGNGNLVYGTITTISVSPLNSEIVYAGTDDGNVWVTTDNGANWENISGALPVRWVTRVAAHPTEELTAFVCLSGYRYNEYIPHILKTEDAGQNWLDISGNLPEAPVNDVIPDPDSLNTLYVATDLGVYVSRDGGADWKMLGHGLPLVPVCDLRLHNPTRKLVAATFGRSMYAYDLYQDTIVTGVSKPVTMAPSLSVNPYPNPFRGDVTLQINCADETTGEITIYCPDGRELDRIPDVRFKRGMNVVRWSSAGKSGYTSGNRVLLARVTAGNSARVVRLLEIAGN